MDALYALVFMLVNLLPAPAKQCTISLDGLNDDLMKLEMIEKGVWQVRNISEPNNVRTYKVTPKTIQTLNPETKAFQPEPVEKNFDLKKINWKKAKTIEKLGESPITFYITREKGTLRIKTNNTEAPELKVVYK